MEEEKKRLRKLMMTRKNDKAKSYQCLCDQIHVDDVS